MNAKTTSRRLIVTGATIALALPVGLAAAAPASAATDAQMLQWMATEEKLAHDVYVSLGELYDARQFDNIANAETRHLEAVRTLLDRYGYVDPTAGDKVGEFDDAAVQKLYDDFVASGSTSLAAAAQVGVDIEKLDIADLQDVLDTNPAADITAVLTALQDGSKNHLAAFTRLASGQAAVGTQAGAQNSQGRMGQSQRRGMGQGTYGTGRGMGQGMYGTGQGTQTGARDGSCL